MTDDEFIGCEHKHTHFITSSRGVGAGMGSHHVSICKNCGSFLVQTRLDGVVYNLSFTLNTKESIAYAQKYREHLGLD